MLSIKQLSVVILPVLEIEKHHQIIALNIIIIAMRML